MSTAAWVALGLTVWLGIAIAVSVVFGRALHRRRHVEEAANLADCPPWCVRERAAALFQRQPRGRQSRGRHHRPTRTRVHLGRRHR